MEHCEVPVRRVKVMSPVGHVRPPRPHTCGTRVATRGCELSHQSRIGQAGRHACGDTSALRGAPHASTAMIHPLLPCAMTSPRWS